MPLFYPVNKLGQDSRNVRMKLPISFVLLFALLAVTAALPTGKMPRKMRLKSLRSKLGVESKLELGGACVDAYKTLECPPTTETGVHCCKTTEKEGGVDTINCRPVTVAGGDRTEDRRPAARCCDYMQCGGAGEIFET